MKRIVAAVKDDGRNSLDMVRYASLLSKAEKADLLLVYVYEVPHSKSLEENDPKEMQKGDEILNRALSAADDAGVNVEAHIIQSRTAGGGILSEIRDIKPELLLMGVGRKDDFESFGGYGTVDYVLKHSDCRVLLMVDPSGDEPR